MFQIGDHLFHVLFETHVRLMFFNDFNEFFAAVEHSVPVDDRLFSLFFKSDRSYDMGFGGKSE
jgi:hypothetical protein